MGDRRGVYNGIMKCDLHVHTIHSGMCTVPVMRALSRESCSAPQAVYDKLKRQGMNLVTITDHDSIGALERLRSQPDFFLSEEVACRLPSGTELHMGVYDIRERDHHEIQKRRDDFASLLAFLTERNIFFSADHIFSRLTGRRELAGFDCFENHFPAFETLIGCMPAAANRRAGLLAGEMRKAPIAGSDAHTLRSVGSCWTEVAGARNKAEFFAGLRRGVGRVRGASGSYWKLTRDVFEIGARMMRDNPYTAPVALLGVAVPAITLLNYCLERVFVDVWTSRLSARAPLGGRAGVAIPGEAAA
ncbi:MAG: PHP-associated domain-containing protein [Bryobacteraceae bacterium]